MKKYPSTLIIIVTALLFLVYTPKNDDVKVRVLQPQYVADFINPRVLVGASHNAFVGKVIRQVGSERHDLWPETQFEVQVISNIKGNLEGIVIVNQEGGYKDRVLYVFELGDSDSYMLEPGSTYLMATRYSKQYGWYTVISHEAGKKLITNDDSKDEAQLRAMIENDSRVAELEGAYKHEILLDADVKNNNTLNSYNSLNGE